MSKEAVKFAVSIPPEVEREMTPAVRAFVVSLMQQLQRRDEERDARIAELERQLKQARKFQHTATNEAEVQKSEATPTAESVSTSPEVGQAAGERPKRKRGGQPGHKKHTRELRPTAECDEVVVLRPEACRRCGEGLSGTDPEPWRHQVIEIPEIKPTVTEYQRQRLTCSCCGITTCAELPSGVPTGQAGPRLVALNALLMVCFRLSKRRVSLFCETLLNVSLCPATVVKMQNIATEATRSAYDTLVKKLPKQEAVNADETPTTEANRNAWIWAVVAATFTVFTVRLTKAACVIRELLTPEFAGVVTSDRAKMYLWCVRLQWCWAHLKRDFEAMAERPGEAGKIGTQLAELTYDMFHHWHRARDGTVTWATFKTHQKRLYGEVYLALDEGSYCADQATAATCLNLLEGYENLWRFAETAPSLDPTNNAAERALRHPVIWKQLSFGTQSAAGSRFVETLLTVLETCRQREKNAFTYLTQAITAHFAGEKTPSLLARV